MLRLLKYINKKSWMIILLIVFLVSVQVFCELQMPDYLNNILQTAQLYLIGGIDKATANNEIWKSALIMFGIAAGSVTSTIIVCYLASIVPASFSAEVRRQLFKKVNSFSMTEIDKFSTSSLITRSTNDITQIQMVMVMVLRMAIAAPIYCIYGIIKALKIQGAEELSYIVIISVFALVVLVISIFIIILPRFKKIQKLTDRLNLVTRENLTGLRVVKASQAATTEEEKFKKANNDITENNIFVNRVFSIFQPGISMIMNFTSLAIMWVGAYLVVDNPLILSSVFTFQQYTMLIVMGFMQLTMIMILVPRAIISGNRVYEILSTPCSITNKEHTKDNNNIKGKVEFRNVSFSYSGSDEKVLEDINFTVNRGETLAIIGSTGSGKTTLISLVNRLLDATEGSVLVDDVEVKDYDLKTLRDKIGFVPQKALLFSGTIRSNLLFANKEANDEQMYEALEISQAKDLVDKVGLDANVAQGGANFSGGQKQRLCIARAIIKKPEILIFDDSFSALDLKTDKALRQALASNINDTTNIIVAQRIGTILHADKIIVLEEGKIVGYGRHDDLIKNCAVYQEIAYSQLSKEELNNA